MNDTEMKQRIGALLRERRTGALSVREIAEALAFHGKNAKRLSKWLNDLVRDGEIVRIRGNRYTLGRTADLVSGRLTVLRSGNGLVIGTGESEGITVFVSAVDMGTALPGDLVLVRVHRTVPGPALADTVERVPARQAGRIVRVLERARRDVVGTLRSTGRFYYVVPLDTSYRKDFYVPDPKGTRIDDRVVVRFTSWDNQHVNPEGEIIEILGPADDPSIDTLAIIRNYGLRDTFPTSVLREAEAVSAWMDKPGPRVDLRDMLIVTIDPERARDFDDALSLTADEHGNRVLGVHIADVSHFVRPGSALDREARVRGNSVYFPDRVLPMLPEQLSNGVCSLRPNEDRLSFSCFLTIDSTGVVKARRFAKSVIRSRHRLTYEQVMAVLDDDKAAARLPRPTVMLLRQLDRLAQQLRKRRFARYALDLDVPECEVIMGPNGMMTGIRVVPNDRSHQLVEECMVAANEAVATELANRAVPAIARLHEPPDEEKIEVLIAELQGLGLAPGNLHDRAVLAAFLARMKNDPLAYHVKVAVLKSMKRAVYSVTATGHFGLAKKFYTHFTSPIRRYPDLVIHRQLFAALEARRGACERQWPAGGYRYPKEELVRIAEGCTNTEQVADEAERSLLEIKKFRFLEQELARHEARPREAVVVGVTNFGMFVEILDLQLEGLMHISAISDNFVRYNPERGTLSDGRRTYKVGTKIRVKAIKVDFDKRQIDFVPVRD